MRRRALRRRGNAKWSDRLVPNEILGGSDGASQRNAIRTSVKDLRSNQGQGNLTLSLATPGLCSEGADGFTQNNVRLFREPDARNLCLSGSRNRNRKQNRPNRIEAAKREPRPRVTGRLQSLRLLFSTLLAIDHGSMHDEGCPNGKPRLLDG